MRPRTLPHSDDSDEQHRQDESQRTRQRDNEDQDERADGGGDLAPTRAPRRLTIELAGMLTLVVVAVATAGFAELFKSTIGAVGGVIADTADPTDAARTMPVLALLAVGTSAAIGAMLLGRRAVAGGHRPHGMTGLADAVSDRGAGPSLRTTWLRAGGTWLASCGMLSIGRESAILETGGTLGWQAGRRFQRLRRFAPALAAAGVSGAFTAAYHAPIAGVLYVEEHLRGRRDLRSMLYTLGGATIAHFTALHLLGGHPLLPQTQGDRGGMVVLAAIGLLPAVAGSRLFLYARDRATHRLASRPLTPTSAIWLVPLLPLSAAAVAVVPLVAGNGMDALHHASTETTISVALALAIGKLLATAIAFGAGVPGGAFWATLAVSSGWALLTFVTLDAVGFDLPGAYWDGMLAAMAVGVAIGLRSPVVGVFAIAEMSGDLTLVPLLAAVVVVAVVIDRRAERWQSHRSRTIDVRDDDA